MNISVEVLVGEIQVSVLGFDQTETKTFKAMKTPHIWTFVHQENDDYTYTPHPIRLKVKANTVTLYRLAVTTDGDNKKHLRLKKGLPTFVSVGQNNPACVDGTLEGKEHKIIISTHAATRDRLSSLRITSKLADKLVNNFTKNIV